MKGKCAVSIVCLMLYSACTILTFAPVHGEEEESSQRNSQTGSEGDESTADYNPSKYDQFPYSQVVPYSPSAYYGGCGYPLPYGNQGYEYPTSSYGNQGYEYPSSSYGYQGYEYPTSSYGNQGYEYPTSSYGNQGYEYPSSSYGNQGYEYPSANGYGSYGVKHNGNYPGYYAAPNVDSVVVDKQNLSALDAKRLADKLHASKSFSHDVDSENHKEIVFKKTIEFRVQNKKKLKNKLRHSKAFGKDKEFETKKKIQVLKLSKEEKVGFGV